eukprot:g1678.t1
MQVRRNADSKVLENQTKFQKNSHLHGADNPTYLKEGSDKMVNMAIVAVAGICTFGAFRGMYSMSYGINKNE